jgi:hypothetical protein
VVQAAGVHDPGKIRLDLALAVALGGGCLSDIGMLRADPGLFGLVTSDPTVSRLVEAVAGAGPRVLTAIRRAGPKSASGCGNRPAPTPPHCRTGHRGHRRSAGPGALRPRGRDRDMEDDLWASPAGPVRRPRPGRIGGTGRGAAAARQRGQQHRRRSHHHHETAAGPTTRTPPAGPLDTDPRRLRRRHPRVPQLGHRTRPLAVLLGRG